MLYFAPCFINCCGLAPARVNSARCFTPGSGGGRASANQRTVWRPVDQSEASIGPLCGARISVASSRNPRSDWPGLPRPRPDHNSDKIPRNGSISNSTWVVQLNSEATSLTTKLISKPPPSSDDNFKINNHFNYCQLLLIDKDPRYYFDHVYKVRLSDFKNLSD